MKIYAVRILVNDWEAACDFYENKIGLTAEFKNAEFGWAELDVGGAKFGIERADADQSLVGRFLGVSLQVDNVDKTYADLIAKGVEFTAPPQKQDWGGTLAHFKDPDGNVVTLMSEG